MLLLLNSGIEEFHFHFIFILRQNLNSKIYSHQGRVEHIEFKKRYLQLLQIYNLVYINVCILRDRVNVLNIVSIAKMFIQTQYWRVFILIILINGLSGY